MDLSQGAAPIAQAGAAGALSPLLLAKAALRRLAVAKIEPTPENYARAYTAEGGQSAAVIGERARSLLQRLAVRSGASGAQCEALVKALMDGRWDDAESALDNGSDEAGDRAQGWAELLRRLARGLERGSRLWTAARKKDSLQRVLANAGNDAQRLQNRMRQLLAQWEAEVEEAEPLETRDSQIAELPADRTDSVAAGDAAQPDPLAPNPASGDWLPIVNALCEALGSALPDAEPRATELSRGLAEWAAQLKREGPTEALAAQADAMGQRARRLLAHRQHLLDELGKLCGELTQGLSELAEDDSWARGQGEVMRQQLAEGLSVRSVRAAGEVLAEARTQQAVLRAERQQARDALKTMIQGMLNEVGEFGRHTGRFHDNVGRHAEAIAQAESLDSLAGVVREMLDESHTVQAVVSQTQERLRAEQARAGDMQARVDQLESELRRLSEEVSTDALTQVANRRGLAKAFEAEQARLQRAAGNGDRTGLAVGLLDIDNFKKLNDTLGHAAGDVALQNLAARVREQLRPRDTVARFGGEEFVVLLPDTDCAEAQQVLGRLQRKLTASLFMHENREVFVTFSAGVTALREGEAMEAALERADEALYEAKRTGKNRTCLA
jgi:diguanylate cyclase